MGYLIAYEKRMVKVFGKLLEEVFQTKAQVSKGQSKQDDTSNYTQLGRNYVRDIFHRYG